MPLPALGTHLSDEPRFSLYSGRARFPRFAASFSLRTLRYLSASLCADKNTRRPLIRLWVRISLERLCRRLGAGCEA